MLPVLRSNVQARLEDNETEDGDCAVTVGGTLWAPGQGGVKYLIREKAH
jgi:hypothetical protein